MMERIEAFKTSDGCIFENETLANAHEFGNRYKDLLAEFFNGKHSSYRGDTAQGSIIRRAIVEWEAFMADRRSE